MFDLIVAAAKELGHPVEGEFAAKLWELCSGNDMSPMRAKRLYMACGYEPFSGYPLTRLKCNCQLTCRSCSCTKAGVT